MNFRTPQKDTRDRIDMRSPRRKRFEKILAHTIIFGVVAASIVATLYSVYAYYKL
jgi:hypothetical protein